MNEMNFYEITDKNRIIEITKNISDEQFVRKYFHYEDFQQKFGLNDLLIIPTLQQTLVLIVPLSSIELGYIIPFSASRIGKIHFYQLVYGVYNFRYYKVIDQEIANQVQERAQKNENYADLISFRPLHYKVNASSSSSRLINPASLCSENNVYIIIETTDLLEEYIPPDFLVDVSHAEYYSELLKTKADQNFKESKYKQKYLIYEGAKIPLPKVLENSAEAARGFCGFLKGISSAGYKVTNEGFVFFNND